MKGTNKVFIAKSIDGFIADKNGGIDWLHTVPNPNGDDMGYSEFMKDIDALVMGRHTFETVRNFDMDWPYQIPVFVLSESLNFLPSELKDKVFLVKGSSEEVLTQIHDRGYHKLCIDGGKTIQNFLRSNRIDELVLTTIPVVLGNGIPLFSELPKSLKFDLVKSKVYLSQISQQHYRKV
ncbi:MAG TPA: diacylglycerol kinase [Cytophagales bacterium]|jgi:dihydrofolate reductase|nr:diacylglycerol kinase [Cytophagales bacterium]